MAYLTPLQGLGEKTPLASFLHAWGFLLWGGEGGETPANITKINKDL